MRKVGGVEGALEKERCVGLGCYVCEGFGSAVMMCVSDRGGIDLMQLGDCIGETYYFSTHGCSAAFSSLAVCLEDEVPFVAAAFAAAARALLSKKLAMTVISVVTVYVNNEAPAMVNGLAKSWKRVKDAIAKTINRLLLE